MKAFVLAFFLGCFSHNVIGQNSLIHENSAEIYHEGLALFQLKNYVAAKSKFETFINFKPPVAEKPHQILLSNAKFYHAICAIELGQPDAEKLLLDYIEFEEESPTKVAAYFYLGKLMIAKKKFKDAIAYFKQTEVQDLSRSEQDEYKFYVAYSHFNLKELEAAYPLFRQIIQVENKFYYPSNYYYAYISYTLSKWDDALKSFERIKASKIYEKTVPYYIAQIYFQKKQYQQLVDYLQPLLDNNQVKYQEELSLTIGQAYFELGKYQMAAHYIGSYTKSNNARKEELFQLGYAYYKTEKYDSAITQLKRLDHLNDTIGQNALYILGKSFLANNRKSEAASAFQKAARIEIDTLIIEASLFNQAKLSAELGNDKFAIEATQFFLQKYPNSKYGAEAKEILSLLLLSTKNFKDALVVIESIENPTPTVLKAYQQVAFFRANELLNDKNYAAAILLYKTALKNPVSNDIKAQTYFGLGESYFQTADYNASIKYFLQFLDNNSSVDAKVRLDKLINAYYTVGYAYFKLKNYTASAQFFSKTISQIQTQNSASGKLLYADALLRNGDSFFMLKNYTEAMKNYQAVIDKSAPGSDYALMQKATIQGNQNLYEDKIRTLLYLQNLNPKSVYVDDAIYYIGESYFFINKIQEAIQSFDKISQQFPNSPFVSKSYLKKGLIYYNQNNIKGAADSYRWIIEKYPQSNDAQEALLALKEMSISEGNPDIYMNIVNENRNLNVSFSEKDSITYLSAESLFANGNCENAIEKFNNYLTTFPNGHFELRAYFYRSECLFKTKNYQESLSGYEYVAAAGQNIFLEKAVLKAAEINFYEIKDYTKSTNFYLQLLEIATYSDNIFTAHLGLMRSNFYLQKWNELEKHIQFILKNEATTPEQLLEAEYYVAKLYEFKNNTKEARLYFNKVTEKSSAEMGAESKYKLALFSFIDKDFKAAEELCFSTIQDYSAYENWVVKAYILLADIYIEQDNAFQAKATLESIIENTSLEDLKKLAQEKLDFILENEENTRSIIPEGIDLENPLDTIQLN